MIIIQNFKLCEEIKLIKEKFSKHYYKTKTHNINTTKKNKGERTDKQGRTNRETRANEQTNKAR